jgi:nucleotide-binding universal stress UspA family protein
MEVDMLKALVPVDGTGNSLGAIRHVVKLVQEREPLEIHLLNVEPHLPGHISRFLSKDVLDVYRHDEAEKAFAPARALLDAAGIAYTEHMLVGHAAHVIADLAKKLHCDKVIMGTHGYGTVSQLLLGSVSHEAIHMMDPEIPVTLVKNAVEAPPGKRPSPIDDGAASHPGASK